MNISERTENIRAAKSLHDGILEAGYGYGCLEVALTALGANFTLDMVNREGREASPLLEVIERAGLKINWLVSTDGETSTNDMNALLRGLVPLEESYPDAELTGYLWTETYPDQAGHALAIFPNEDDDYLVMDTEVTGLLSVTADNLAHMANYVAAQGGQFEIAQIKKLTT